MKFIHTADWQLGMTRHFLSAEAQARFSQARLDAVRSIGQLAVEEGCGFVVVCGDVFESNQIDRQVLTRAFDAVAATPSVTFCLLPGNHDPRDAASIYISNSFRERKPNNVVVLDGNEPFNVADGVELLAAPWTSKRPLVDLVDRASELAGPSDALRVVVGHGALDSRSPDSADPSLISLSRLESRIREGEIHYVALGDRHSTTDEGSSGRIWYSGAPEPTDYVEVDPGNVLLVELDSDRCTVEPRRVGTWAFERVERQLSSEADIEMLEGLLDAVTDKERTVLKLALIGQVTLAQHDRLDRLLEHCTDRFAAVEAWERRSDLHVLPDDAEAETFGLSGFAAEALGELRDLGQSSDDAEAAEARDAMALLYRLTRSAS
ncbi:metallophosphoesterase family protein [Candidatus Poriferisodalis sp.]|uniref:metallophosphoesterase family protein n=1 Tax=Candidatus Poriferisodalis sp. TaxID=3101277 RepID=UPI003B5CEEFB